MQPTHKKTETVQASDKKNLCELCGIFLQEKFLKFILATRSQRKTIT